MYSGKYLGTQVSLVESVGLSVCLSHVCRICTHVKMEGRENRRRNVFGG